MYDITIFKADLTFSPVNAMMQSTLSARCVVVVAITRQIQLASIFVHVAADASFHPFSANLVNTMIDDGRHDTYNLIVRNNSYMHQQLRPCADLVEVFAYSSTFPGSKDE